MAVNTIRRRLSFCVNLCQTGMEDCRITGRRRRDFFACWRSGLRLGNFFYPCLFCGIGRRSMFSRGISNVLVYKICVVNKVFMQSESSILIQKLTGDIQSLSVDRWYFVLTAFNDLFHRSNRARISTVNQ